MITLYKCEVCGRISEHKSDIEKCECRGDPIPLVKEGDIIYFKDCEETPILYKATSRIRKICCDNYEEEYCKSNCDYNWINELHKYIVSKIVVRGHHISYILDATHGESRSFDYAKDQQTEPFHYPTIEGNDMMELVLKLYNKNKEEI